MADLYIVVEGTEDENFITQLIAHNIDTSKTFEFIYTSTNASSLSDELIMTINIETSSLEIPTVFVMDADHDPKEGKLALTKAFIDLDEQSIFMIPNDSDPGNLETLLRASIPQKYAPLLSDCIDDFAQCVNTLDLKEYAVGEKDKFFIYHSGLTRKNAADSERLYQHPFYDLESAALNPLIKFLNHHLS